MKGFYYLIQTYGEEYSVPPDDIDSIAGELSQAVRKLVMADLKLSGFDNIIYWDSEEIGGSELKRKIKDSIKNKKPDEIRGHINYLFSSNYAFENYYKYRIEIEDVDILLCKGTPKSVKSVYDMLEGYIGLNTIGTRIKFNFFKMQQQLQKFMKTIDISVEGKKDIGVDIDVDELLHGNQVIETLTENGITFNIEKSGDLPSDPNERKIIIDSMREDLNKLKNDGVIINYEINEFANKTNIKTYSKKLQDFSKVYDVNGFDFTRLND